MALMNSITTRGRALRPWQLAAAAVALAALMFTMWTLSARADVANLVVGNNNTTVSADLASAFFDLDANDEIWPSVTEDAFGDLQTGDYIRLTPPVGYEFNGGGGVFATPSGGGSFALGADNFSAEYIEFHVNAPSTDTPVTITFVGLHLKANADNLDDGSIETGVFNVLVSVLTDEDDVLFGPVTLATFTIQAGAPHHIELTGPLTVVAGVASTNLTIEVQDQYGNATNVIQNTTFVLTEDPPGDNPATFDPASPIEIEAGNSFITFTYSDDDAGDGKTITATATDGDAVGFATHEIDVLPRTPDATLSTVVAAAPSAVVSELVGGTTVTVTVRDEFGNPIEDVNVLLQGNRPSVDIGPEAGMTNEDGEIVFTVLNTVAETVTFTATVDGSIELDDQPTVTFTAGEPAGLWVDALDTNVADGDPLTGDAVLTITAGAPFAILVTVIDEFNNVVDHDGAVDLAFAFTGATTAPSGVHEPEQPEDGAVAFEDGFAEIAGFRTYNASNTPSISVSFTDSDPSIEGTGSTLAVNPAAPSVTVAQALNTNTAGGTPTTTVTAGELFAVRLTVYDAYQNIATNFDRGDVGLTVTSTADPSPNATDPALHVLSGHFAFTDGVTNITGFALFDAATVDDAVTITLTGNELGDDEDLLGIADSTDALVVLAAAADADESTVVADDDDVPVSDVTGATITVTVKDAFGNLVPDQTVTLVGDPDDDVVIGAASGDSNVSGVVTFAVRSEVDGAVEFTATVTTPNPDVIIADKEIVNFSAGDAVYLAVTGAASMVAGGENQLTVTAYDAFDNVATGYTGSHNLAFTGLGNSPNNTAATIEDLAPGSSRAVTFTAGVSAANVLTLQAHLATPSTTVHVFDQGDANLSSDDEDAPGADAGLVLEVTPDVLVEYVITRGDGSAIGAGTVATAGVAFTIDVTGYDAYENIVTASGTIDIDSDVAGAAASNVAFDGTLDDYPITFTGVMPDAGATITVSDSDDTPSVSNSTAGFTVQPGELERFEIWAIVGDPSTPIADPQQAGVAFTVDILAVDAFDNQLYFGDNEFGDDPGETVDLFVTDSRFLGLANGEFVTTGTFNAGFLNDFPVTLVGANPDVSLTAIVTGGSEFGDSNDFDVLPGAPASLEWDAGNPSGTFAPGEFDDLTFVALVKDLYGNTIDDGSLTGDEILVHLREEVSAGVFEDDLDEEEQVAVDEDGVVTVTGIQIRSTGIYQLVAIFGPDFTGQIDPGSAFDEIATPQFTIEIGDLIVDGTDVTYDPDEAGAENVLTFNFTTSLPIPAGGSITIDFVDIGDGTVPGDLGTGDVSINGGAVGDDVVDADGDVVTIVLADELPAGGVTIAVSRILTPSVAGSLTYDVATFDEKDLDLEAGTLTGLLDPGPAAYLEIWTEETSFVAGEPFVVTVTARTVNHDLATSYKGIKQIVFGGLNVAPDGTVATVNVTDFGDPASMTFTDGEASFTLTGFAAGAQDISVSDFNDGTLASTDVDAPGFDVDLSVTLTHGALASFRIDDDGDPLGDTVAGASFTIDITALDTWENVVTAFNGADNTVSLTSNADGPDAVGLGVTATFTNGRLLNKSITLTAATGSATIVATDSVAVGLGDGTQTGASDSFEVFPGDPTTLVVVDQPDGTGTGELDDQPVIAVHDDWGNLVDLDAGTVTASIKTGPAGALSGDTEVEILNGVATFLDLALDTPFDGYVLTFTASDGDISPVDSGVFEIDGGPITGISVVSNALGAGQQPTSFVVTFTTTSGIPAGGYVLIEFPAGFALAAGADIRDTATATVNGGGVDVDNVVTTGRLMEVYLDGVVPGGEAVVVTLVEGITNPETTGTTDNFVLETRNDDDVLIDEGDVAGFDIEVGDPSPSKSTVTPTSASVVANGVTSSIITVTVLDAYDNPIEGVEVELTPDMGSSIITPLEVETDENGQIFFEVTNTVDQVVIYTAFVDPDGLNIEITSSTALVSFTPPVPHAGLSTVGVDQPSRAADGVAEAIITVTVLDAGGEPIVGRTVTLGQGAGSSIIVATADGETDGDGVAVFTVSSIKAEPVTYTATVVGTPNVVLSADTVQVTFTPGAPDHIILTGPASVTVNLFSTNFTLTVRDVNDNPTVVTGDQVFEVSSDTLGIQTFAGNAVLNGLVYEVTVLDGTSNRTFTYRDSRVGPSKTVTAIHSAAGPLGDASRTINVTAASGGGDPTPTPPTTLPPQNPNSPDPTVDLGAGVTTVMTPNTGASISAQTGDIITRVTVPAGALPDGTEVRLSPIVDMDQLEALGGLPAGADIVAGIQINATSNGSAVTGDFAEPIEITFEVPASSVPANATPTTLVIAYWNGSSWSAITGTVTVNADGSLSVSALVTHFTTFAVIHQPGRGLFNPAPRSQGSTMTIWGGGGYDLLAAALGERDSVWVLVDGKFVGYALGVPDFVNARFRALFPTDIEANTVLMVVRAKTPATPTTPPPSSKPSTPLPAAETWTVKVGDSLISIGAATGVPWMDIAAANGIKGPGYLIEIGQVLDIPAS